jgi:hypothetical protein
MDNARLLSPLLEISRKKRNGKTCKKMVPLILNFGTDPDVLILSLNLFSVLNYVLRVMITNIFADNICIVPCDTHALPQINYCCFTSP